MLLESTDRVSLALMLGNGLRKNLPFRRLRTSFLWHEVPQLVEEFLHLCSPLSLGQLVADSQFRCAAIWLVTTRTTTLFGLKITQVLVLHGMMMNWWKLAAARHPAIVGGLIESALAWG
jgi:hypothetical protein